MGKLFGPRRSLPPPALAGTASAKAQPLDAEQFAHVLSTNHTPGWETSNAVGSPRATARPAFTSLTGVVHNRSCTDSTRAGPACGRIQVATGTSLALRRKASGVVLLRHGGAAAVDWPTPSGEFGRWQDARRLNPAWSHVCGRACPTHAKDNGVAYGTLARLAVIRPLA